MTDAICIDVPFAYQGLFRTIISAVFDRSKKLEFCDKTMQHDWKTQKAYNGQIAKHSAFLENNEMIQIQNLELEEFDRIDDDLLCY